MPKPKEEARLQDVIGRVESGTETERRSGTHFRGTITGSNR